MGHCMERISKGKRKEEAVCFIVLRPFEGRMNGMVANLNFYCKEVGLLYVLCNLNLIRFVCYRKKRSYNKIVIFLIYFLMVGAVATTEASIKNFLLTLTD